MYIDSRRFKDVLCYQRFGSSADLASTVRCLYFCCLSGPRTRQLQVNRTRPATVPQATCLLPNHRAQQIHDNRSRGLPHRRTLSVHAPCIGCHLPTSSWHLGPFGRFRPVTSHKNTMSTLIVMRTLYIANRFPHTFTSFRRLSAAAEAIR
jgi:hypothetical protein